MDYGLMLTKEKINILDKNNINYYYWNISEDTLNNEIEVAFDEEMEYKKACKILKM